MFQAFVNKFRIHEPGMNVWLKGACCFALYQCQALNLDSCEKQEQHAPCAYGAAEVDRLAPKISRKVAPKRVVGRGALDAATRKCDRLADVAASSSTVVDAKDERDAVDPSEDGGVTLRDPSPIAGYIP
eukprot:TRINITY_DN76469_c0_g1_i1.p2 TRINITY_DN76469_c0_g1~~TRINITY_DN76469_c0_g1_i1.p2  ORF type:complete len:129 (-),score=18.70 TRINITY_DN76469_c0_g1_i1:69-455(-)